MAEHAKPTTTDVGIPVASDEHLLTVGPDGPILLQDHYLIEQMANFNRERGAPKALKTKEAPAKVGILATARSTPVELTIPAISLTVSLSTLGLNADGTVQVPTDIQQPGWYGLGPSPGEIGSAMILGHVDSSEGPAVFFKLRSLVAGDIVNTSLADGVIAEFKVTSVAMYLKTDFPDQAVYTSHGDSALQPVICGGAFDTQTGHYLSNIVVYTSLVALIPPAAVPKTGVAP